jgi:hypothetical protein
MLRQGVERQGITKVVSDGNEDVLIKLLNFLQAGRCLRSRDLQAASNEIDERIDARQTRSRKAA